VTDSRARASQMLSQLSAGLAAGEEHFAAGRFGLAARAGYDVIESALKAALVSVGVEPPPWADVGPQLDEHRGRFPAPMQPHVDSLIHSVRVAWEEREAGFESGVGEARAEHLYDDYDARGALDTASRVLRQVREWIDA
jgi:HEPN domain-containing protein